MAEVTRIIEAIGQGDAHVAEELLPLVYDEYVASRLRNCLKKSRGRRCRPRPLCMRRTEGEDFLESPPVDSVEAPKFDGPNEVPGTVIGRYKLLELIGEGGFGDVWMAEQIDPVCRTVALKIIKLGMDTKQVIARFEAERQALALMDHPNIAKVLDAGGDLDGAALLRDGFGAWRSHHGVLRPE